MNLPLTQFWFLCAYLVECRLCKYSVLHIPNDWRYSIVKHGSLESISREEMHFIIVAIRFYWILSLAGLLSTHDDDDALSWISRLWSQEWEWERLDKQSSPLYRKLNWNSTLVEWVLKNRLQHLGSISFRSTSRSDSGQRRRAPLSCVRKQALRTWC